jgi:TonB family protein
MSKVVARSIFNETVVERNWRNYFTSGVIHAVVIGLAFLIIVPAVQVMKTPTEDHVTLIAPIVPRYHPTIQAPQIPHFARLTMPIPSPVVKITPHVVTPPVAKVVAPPAAKAVVPQPQIVAEAKPAPAPAPKPVLTTGVFEEAQQAKADAVRKQVVVGGFGDPRGVHAAERPEPSPVLMAKVGSFDGPQGAGQAGGGGREDQGVRQSGFGSADTTGGPSGSARGMVHTGNFGDGQPGGTGHASSGSLKSSGFGEVASAAPQRREVQPALATSTPVEILFKPRPSYSEEARSMHLEGQVALQVVFQASGAVKVVRVIKGLGHGLDEAAEQAALQVRFKPATRSGTPVDMNATISITFELS